ncbi:hypothetical protein FACS18949_11840 [Clostridia bacterium]|nr:hypothetical protein FACS18949_11840 [Clostridia bacterium]
MDKPFCPLLSTSAQRVQCDEKCMWFVKPTETAKSQATCAVPYQLFKLQEEVEDISALAHMR